MDPLFKEIVIARAGKNFVNGDMEFDLTRDDIDRIIANTQRLGRQVQILLTPTHLFGSKRSNIPAAGWVEAMRRNGDDWMARVKLLGEAAAGVMKDAYRGVSIGTASHRDQNGKPTGEFLDHLLITNSPFFNLPSISGAIAASRQSGGDEAVRYISPARWSNTMTAEEKAAAEAAEKAAAQGMSAEEKLALAQKKHEDEAVELKAANLRLKEENDELQTKLANANVDKDKEAALIENVNLKRRCFAQDVRALVDQGLNRSHTLKAAWCDGYMGKSVLDYEGTIRWLKASPKFFDASAPNPEDQALRNLKFVVENGPVQYTVGKSYASGTPANGGQNLTLSQEDKDLCKQVGSDPERIAAMTDETTYKEWLALKAQK